MVTDAMLPFATIRVYPVITYRDVRRNRHGRKRNQPSFVFEMVRGGLGECGAFGVRAAGARVRCRGGRGRHPLRDSRLGRADRAGVAAHQGEHGKARCLCAEPQRERSAHKGTGRARESIYRGMPASVVVAQACAHNHPGSEKDAADVERWLQAACILAGKDAVALGLLTAEGKLVAPRASSSISATMTGCSAALRLRAASPTCETAQLRRQPCELHAPLSGYRAGRGGRAHGVGGESASMSSARCWKDERSLAGAGAHACGGGICVPSTSHG